MIKYILTRKSSSLGERISKKVPFPENKCAALKIHVFIQALLSQTYPGQQTVLSSSEPFLVQVVVPINCRLEHQRKQGAIYNSTTMSKAIDSLSPRKSNT